MFHKGNYFYLQDYIASLCLFLNRQFQNFCFAVWSLKMRFYNKYDNFHTKWCDISLRKRSRYIDMKTNRFEAICRTI